MKKSYKISETVDILSRTPKVLHNLLLGLPEELLKANEGKDTWSPFDVVGHLIHGEKTDWIVRTKVILSNVEDKTFIPFDRFVQLEENKEKTIEELLNEFEKRRQNNLEELISLNIKESDLIKTGNHPELGEVTLEHLLSCWTVHDLGHIAQISRVIAKQYKSLVGPWSQYLTILK